MVPWPFSRAVLRIGAPITVAREADEPQRESKRQELETVLNALSA